MAYIVRNLPNLTPTSSAATATIALGLLDDASVINLFLASSANANTSAATIQVTQFDPNDSAALGSSAWYTLSTAIATITSSGSQVVIQNIGFRGLRLSITTSNAGEVIAAASKQITV